MQKRSTKRAPGHPEGRPRAAQGTPTTQFASKSDAVSKRRQICSQFACKSDARCLWKYIRSHFAIKSVTRDVLGGPWRPKKSSGGALGHPDGASRSPKGDPVRSLCAQRMIKKGPRASPGGSWTNPGAPVRFQRKTVEN
jgi:hypothetical protein